MLNVVTCDCGMELPHRKLQFMIGDEIVEIDSISSLAYGRSMLAEIKNQGYVTVAEVASADAELVAAELPEYPSFSDRDLEEIALRFAALSPKECEASMDFNIAMGLISPAVAARLRDSIKQLAPSMAMLRLSGKKPAQA